MSMCKHRISVGQNNTTIILLPDNAKISHRSLRWEIFYARKGGYCFFI